MTIEAGKYVKKRLAVPLVNHFLDFLQFSGVMQDAGLWNKDSKTTKWKKGNNRLLHLMITVHKSKVVRFYIIPSEEKGYTTPNGRPSV